MAFAFLLSVSCPATRSLNSVALLRCQLLSPPETSNVEVDFLNGESEGGDRVRMELGFIVK